MIIRSQYLLVQSLQWKHKDHEVKNMFKVNNIDTGTTSLRSVLSQLTFTCSKSTTETLEKGLKYAQS